MAQLTAGGVPVYRDSAGVLREYTSLGGSGGANAAVPVVANTFGLDRAIDGLNATVVSTSATMLMNVDAYNARNGGVRVALYDKASLPTMQDTPRWTVYIPGMTKDGREWVAGLQFNTGLAFMLIPDDAAGLMAGDILSLNLGYSA